jgi:hypothetical protein
MSTHPDRRPSVECVIGIARAPVKRGRTLFPVPWTAPRPGASLRRLTGPQPQAASSAIDASFGGSATKLPFLSLKTPEKRPDTLIRNKQKR